jgi:hypothetical protein
MDISNQIELKQKDITDKILHAFFKIVKGSAFSAFIRVPFKLTCLINLLP